MLTETHPLYEAENMLILWFEHAPPDHLIEFQAPLADGDPRADKIPATMVEACRVKNLEQSFDTVLAPWIMRMNAEKRQIFFSVCPREKLRQSERGRWRTGMLEDVSLAVGAWVDLDTDRWEKLIEDEKPPTMFVVATGGVAHLYFRFERAVPIAAAVDTAKKLAAKYGGDDCWNANRLLRIPGTKNWKLWWSDHPAGRSCELHSAEPERVYSGTASDGETVGSFGGDVMALDWPLRLPILNGHEAAQKPLMPEGMTKDNVDRSQIDLRLAVRLFAHGWGWDAIRAVFTNPEYAISAKYIDEGANGDHYIDQTLKAAQSRADAQGSAKRSTMADVGDELKLETTADLAAAPDLQFCVERILPTNGMMMLTGSAKSGKSLAVTDLMRLLAGAEGLFLESFKVNIPGPVLYCQAEISKGSLKYRLNTIAASRGIDWKSLPLKFYNRRFDLGNSKHLGALVKAIKKHGIQYLIVDPMARFHLAAENSQSEMAAVLGNLESAAAEGGCIGTILIHHHGKPSADAPREGAHKARGASTIADWANAYVVLSKNYSDSTGRKYVRVSFELRDEDEPDPFTLMLDKKGLRFTAFNEKEERLAMVRGVRGLFTGTPKKDLVAEVAERLSITKTEADRLVNQDEARQAKSQRAAAAAGAEEPAGTPGNGGGNGHDTLEAPQIAPVDASRPSPDPLDVPTHPDPSSAS